MKWPTIPDPGEGTTSLLEPVRAIKNIVELLTGQRPGAPAPCPKVYKTLIRPGLPNSPIPISQLRDCDFWIDLGNSSRLHYWDADTLAWVLTT